MKKMHSLAAFVTLFICFCNIKRNNAEALDLKPGEATLIRITAQSRLELNSNITGDITHVVCQIHTNRDVLTLSLTQKVIEGSHVSGTDIGVVTLLSFVQQTVTWYLFSSHNKSVDAIVHVTVYKWNEPIPGGCNVEFNLENDPNFFLSYDQTKTLTLYQWSDHGRNRSVLPDPDACEHLTNPLRYDMYVYYLPQKDYSQSAYFDGIKKMITVQDVIKFGRKVSSITEDKLSVHSKFTVTSYTGQGAIYNIIVTDTTMPRSPMAAYVPVTTYSCDLHNTDSCESIGPGGKVLAVIGGVIGLFLVTVGHRFFKSSSFIAAFLAMALITVILLVRFTTLSIAVVLVIGAIVGVILAAGWLALWWCCHGIPTITVLLTGLTAGYIISSILFYSPLGNLEIWGRDFNYGMSFTVGVLIIPVVLLYFTKTLSILSCAFLGSFLFCITVDVFLDSGLKNIILNSVRHGTEPGYVTVTVIGPYRVAEICLTVVWALLFLGGAVFQFLRARGQPDFPENTRRRRRNSIEEMEEERQSLLANSDGHPTLYSQPRLVGVNPVNRELTPPTT